MARRRFVAPPVPRAGDRSVVPAPAEIKIPESGEGKAFPLHRVEVVGSTVYEPSQLEPAWAPKLARKATLRTLYEIAAAITTRYRNDGYILSRAIVPPQDLTNGVAQIQVIEGYIDEVVIEGAVERPRLWAAHAERVKASRPLSAAVLERAVLLLGDLPGVGVSAVLRPSERSPGASQLVLVSGFQRFLLYADSNNRGTRFLGPYQGEVGLTINSPTGRLGSTFLRLNTTYNDELVLFSADHTEQLFSSGTALTISASYLQSNPGSNLRELNVEGESVTWGIGLRHPFVRSRALNVTGFTRFDYLNSDNDLLGSQLTEERTRTLRTGGSIDFVDRLQGVNLLVAQVNQGLGIFGATTSFEANPTRPGADGVFTSLFGRAQRLQRIGGGFNLLIQSAGQYGFDRIPASEQFSFGGDDFGRGYDSAEIIGDHGIASLAELQWGRSLDFRYVEGLQLFASYDYGVVWNRDGGMPGGRRNSASSIAAGARVNLTSWLTGRFTLALPLTRPPTVDRDDGKKRPRAFFGVTARY